MAKEGERKKLKKQHFPPSNRDIFFQGTTWYSLSCVCTKRGTRLKNTSKSGFLHSLEKQIQLKFDTLALQCQKETHPWCLRAASSFPVQGKVETLHEFLQTDPSGHSVPPCQSSRMDVLLAAILFSALLSWKRPPHRWHLGRWPCLPPLAQKDFPLIFTPGISSSLPHLWEQSLSLPACLFFVFGN